MFAPRFCWMMLLGAMVAPLIAGAQTLTDTAAELRIEISIAERRLWVIRGYDTLRAAPAAVGSGRTLRSAARSWTFRTPTGAATVVAKEVDPVWIPPEWHYIEIARAMKLKLAHLEFRRPVVLSGGRQLTIVEGTAGVMGRDSIFRPRAAEEEIVFDGTLFVPPFGSRNRQVRYALGPYRLILSNGVGLHGTPFPESIGKASTHGCIRLLDADITWLFEHVPIGTRVDVM